jgi:hypothetical protein
MSFYVGKKVYCIDKKSPFFGKRLVVDKFDEKDDPIFSEALSGKRVDVKEDQVSEYPPDEKDTW